MSKINYRPNWKSRTVLKYRPAKSRLAATLRVFGERSLRSYALRQASGVPGVGGGERVAHGHSLEAEFERLVALWKDESRFMSSPQEMAMLPSYQRIIGLGPPALPLILRELEREPDFWFWALRAISGQDAVLPDSVGKVDAMAADWLRWANEGGCAW